MLTVYEVVGNIKDTDNQEMLQGKPVAVPFEWFECEKGRIRKAAEDQTELGLAVPGGVREGDILAVTEGKYYYVQLKDADLISISIHSAAEAARVGFELGNRHLSLKISENEIRVPYDEPTFLYLQKLGFDAAHIRASFADYIQCRAHGENIHHAHAHQEQNHEETVASGHMHTHRMPDGTVVTHCHG